MSPGPQLSPSLDHQAYQELFKDRPVSHPTERRSRGHYVLKISQPWTSKCSFSLGTFQLPQTCPVPSFLSALHYQLVTLYP